MSVYINSNDHDSGTSSNGVWNLSKSLQNQYTIISQHMEDQAIPWMWSGTNNLKINFPDEELNHFKVVSLDYSLCSGVNYTSIAALWETNIQDKLDEIKTDTTGAVDVTVAVTYTDSFSFVFTGVPEVVQFLFADPLSTCAGVFNQSETIGHITTITIQTTYMTIYPKYLEFFITQASTQYSTSHGTTPTLLISTKDYELTGQQFEIRNSVSSLTIKIYRSNVTISTVPLSEDWNLIFVPV